MYNAEYDFRTSSLSEEQKAILNSQVRVEAREIGKKMRRTEKLRNAFREEIKHLRNQGVNI